MSSESNSPEASSRTGVTRRSVMVSGVGAASVVGLVACSSSTGSDSSGSGDGAAATGTGTAESSGSGVLTTTDQVPVGGGVVLGEAKVVVTQPSSGTYRAFSVSCPHQGCAVNKVENGQIICPCHNSIFGLDGSVVSGPARRGLSAVEVSVSGQDITRA